MKEGFFMNNNNYTKLFWAIIIGSLIIGLSIYLGFYSLVEQITIKNF